MNIEIDHAFMLKILSIKADYAVLIHCQARYDFIPTRARHTLTVDARDQVAGR